MSDAPASILPRKIGSRSPNRAKSGFSPAMLHVFCERAGDMLGAMLDTRVKVTLDSVGVEPLGDVVPDENAALCAAVIDLNGIAGAATLMPDGAALFHLTDIMLGGDAETDEPVVETAPTSLTDRFCHMAADATMRGLRDACDIAIGPDSLAYDDRIAIVREGAALAVAPAGADVMTIALEIAFGPGKRMGGSR